MKVLLYFLASLSFTTCVGQTRLPIDRAKKVVYSDSATVRKSKAKLYISARKWLQIMFKEYKTIVTVEDSATGRLAVRAVSQIMGDWYTKIRYVLQIDMRNNKYICTITNVETNFTPDQKYSTDHKDKFSSVDNVNNDLSESERDFKEVTAELPTAGNAKEKGEIEKAQYEFSENRRRYRQLIRETNTKATALIASLRKQMLAQTTQ